MRSRWRCGFTMAELVIGVLILGVAIVPIYWAFISSSKTVTSSRLAYMAMQVARETMEELRQVPVDRLEEIKPDWTPVGPRPMFSFTAKMRSANRSDEDPNKVNAGSPSYPEEYRRIKTSIKLEKLVTSGKPPRLWKATVDVAWDEHGGSGEKHRPGLMRYVSLVGAHSVDPEVPE